MYVTGAPSGATMNAVMVYIRELIRLHGLKLKDVQDAAGVAPNYVSRVESGDTKEPSARILIALVSAAKGQLSHLEALLKPEATAKDAERYAAEARAMSDKELEEAVVILRQLRDNPKALDQWLKIGKMLSGDE